MKLLLAIEASQPNGATYRLVLGCYLPLTLISTVAALLRLI